MSSSNGNTALTPEMVSLDGLRAHPRNYRTHPDDQLDHLAKSIQEHGLYRNVVLARDGTILAGHGVVQAARKLGLAEVLAVRLDVDPDDPQALKVLTGDNEIEHLAEQNDRLLSELLKEIYETAPAGLEGTGFDAAMLANLAFVTRPASEIADFDAAAHWAGMPDYTPEPEPLMLTVRFRDAADRQEFCERLEIKLQDSTRSTWYPPRQVEDTGSLKIEA